MSEIRSQATPARDELVHILAGAVLDNPSGIGMLPQHAADRLLAAGWSKPRTVNSAAELDALAEGSVILTGGVASIALTDLNQPVRVWDAGHGAQWTTDRLTFPATVLFTPGDAG